MRVGVIGINHKLADLKLREALAKACHRRFSLGQCLQNDQACVLLSTCNRTEIYFYADDLAQIHSYLLAILREELSEDFDQRLYSYFGCDCFQHLCRVTAGLDSAIIAETEIQGQVKSAYESASDHACLSSELHYLFQKALKVGKQVRLNLPLRQGLAELEHSIYRAGLTYLPDPRQSRILCIGASEINKKIISYLINQQVHDITLCNRTTSHAQDMASTHNIPFLNWEAMEAWHNFDWIICGTKSPEYLITKECLPQKFSAKLIIDLCVPRNVDPTVQDLHIKLINVDQLMEGRLEVRYQQMTSAIRRAEEMIANAAKYQIQLFKQKQLARESHICA